MVLQQTRNKLKMRLGVTTSYTRQGLGPRPQYIIHENGARDTANLLFKIALHMHVYDQDTILSHVRFRTAARQRFS